MANFDPTHHEMSEHLLETFGREIDTFDVETAIYWFAVDYHGGQWTNLYEANCLTGYRPGRMVNSIEDESEISLDLYNELVAVFSPHD